MPMPGHGAPRAVVFRVRFGKEQFTCKGRLVWEGGIAYAVAEEMPEDCPFVPDRIRIEESDLELKTSEAGAPDSYEYHGFLYFY
jgi:hypothetical protein